MITGTSSPLIPPNFSIISLICGIIIRRVLRADHHAFAQQHGSSIAIMRSAFVSHVSLPVRPNTVVSNSKVPVSSPPLRNLPAHRSRARIPPKASQAPEQASPSPHSKPRVTTLALLLVLSVTLWSLLLLPIIFILRLLNLNTPVIHLTRLALANALRTVGISITLRHRENLPPSPCLVVANHQSPLDIFALACLNLPLISVLPARITAIPFIGWLIRLADWVLVKGADRRSQMDSLKKIEERLGDVSVAVFPEGTPSENGVVGRFASPVFKAARKARAKVVPVTLHGGMDVGRVVPERWGNYEVSVHPPMDIGELSDREAAEEARRVIVSGLPEELRS